MKVMADACIAPSVVGQLRVAGHDLDYVQDWPSDPGDDEILARAHQDARVVVTLDKDFGTLAVGLGREHSGIVRLVDIPIKHQAPRCLEVLRDHGEELLRGAIITVEPTRTRIRPAAEH
jgi:predicted nuclease of predicted toxin-antitoxin system